MSASSHMLRDSDMVEMATLLRNNYTLIWDLIQRKRESQFSSQQAHDLARRNMIDTLRRHVDPDMVDYFTGDRDEQKEVMSRVIYAARPEFWPEGYGQLRIHGHRHHVLLHDWKLRYPFTETGHESETLGFPKELIGVVDRLAWAQKMVGEFLGYFPTTTFTPKNLEMDVEHEVQIESLKSLISDAQLYAQEKNRASFTSCMQQAIRINTCRARHEWLHEFAKLYATNNITCNLHKLIEQDMDRCMLDDDEEEETWLDDDEDEDDTTNNTNNNDNGEEEQQEEEEEEEESGNLGSQEECLFCSQVAMANILMLRGRINCQVRSDQARSQAHFKAMFRYFHGHHEQPRPRSDRGSAVVVRAAEGAFVSFEDEIRRIAAAMDVIIHPALYHRENLGMRPRAEQRFPPLVGGMRGRKVMADITRHVNNINVPSAAESSTEDSSPIVGAGVRVFEDLHEGSRYLRSGTNNAAPSEGMVPRLPPSANFPVWTLFR